MDTTPVTKADLKEATDTIVDRIIARVALKSDVEELANRVETLDGSVSTMVSGQDKYLKQTKDWKQEQDLLRASQKRVKDVLVRKGVASESELAV